MPTVGELRGRALFAWLVVCVVWGSTYLAIRVGVETLPPFLLAGVRYLIAGAILAGIARISGESLTISRSDLKTLAIVGVLLLAGGNGLVMWAEQTVESGTASIYIVTVAIWAATFDALVPGGTTRFSLSLLGGLVLGLIGMLMLTGATPDAFRAGNLGGPVSLVVASAFWAYGTVYLKRHPVRTGFQSSAAVQMLAGGVALVLIGLLRHEASAWHGSARGYGALLYLIIFGAIIGFSAYGYALRHASATLVGTYAYVNPVVAVLLGWMVLGESVGLRKIVAMGIILGAVVWIQLSASSRRVTAA